MAALSYQPHGYSVHASKSRHYKGSDILEASGEDVQVKTQEIQDIRNARQA